jgi:hypothetical protein
MGSHMFVRFVFASVLLIDLKVQVLHDISTRIEYLKITQMDFNVGHSTENVMYFISHHFCFKYHLHCDVHDVGQKSTVRRLFTAVAMQRNNGRDQRFLCSPFR